MIPSYQFSPDPRINPNVNPFASMPPGMYQAGVYSAQPAYSSIQATITPPSVSDTAGLVSLSTSSMGATSNHLGYSLMDVDINSLGAAKGRVPRNTALLGAAGPFGLDPKVGWLLVALGAAALTAGAYYGHSYIKNR